MIIVAALFTLAMVYASGTLIFPATPLPRVIRFGLGAVAVSLVVFLLLLVGWGRAVVFVPFGAAVIATALWRRAAVAGAPYGISGHWYLWVSFAVYGVMYLLVALAPEIQPDAVVYHLGLAAEYSRLGHFSSRIGFYELIPQGLEMLFTVAYTLGGGSAAKLVHFAFFLATVPLIQALGELLGIGPWKRFAAALLYFAMPVAGITGTCTYNDAALVFFTVGALYLTTLWAQDRSPAVLWCAGLFAGFCYGIKFTGGFVALAVAAAIVFLAQRARPFFAVSAAAVIPVLPWMIRAYTLTGNPFAPLMNAWFPNPFFNAASEHAVSVAVRSYPAFTLMKAPWEYAAGGGLQGVTGPVLIALPIALFAWRRRAGRILLTAIAVTLLPWLLNAGTRFLMPSVPFAALAMADILPVSLLSVVLAAQLIVSWPSVLNRVEAPYAWSIREIPWRAAMRLENAADYLERSLPSYSAARLVEWGTGAQDRVLLFTGVPKCYTARNVVAFWSSTKEQVLAEALQTALQPPEMVVATARLPLEPLTGIRLAANKESAEEFRVFESEGPASRFSASPNPSEVALAHDRNLATSWRSRSPAERGMFIEAEFDRATMTDKLEIRMARSSVQTQLQVRSRDGKWRTVFDSISWKSIPAVDLRREATRALRDAGYRFLLTQGGEVGLDLIGKDMLRHPEEWNVRDRGNADGVHLIEIL